MQYLKYIILTIGLFQSTSAISQAGIDDFDFYIGSWEVKNKKQLDDGSRVTFDATVEVTKTLNGYGNVDFFKAEINGQPYEGMTFRQYDEEAKQWKIRWFDSDNPMKEPTPSIGKFEDGEGKFYRQMTTQSGHQITVRFLWNNIKENSFHWDCAWSADRETWNMVWSMEFRRVSQ